VVVFWETVITVIVSD